MKTVGELRAFLENKPDHAWVKVCSGDKEVYDLAFLYSEGGGVKPEMSIIDARDYLQGDYYRLMAKIQRLAAVEETIKSEVR